MERIVEVYVVEGPRGPRVFHCDKCATVRRTPVRKMTRAEAEQAGLRPCSRIVKLEGDPAR
jgi:hypothetical protein